MNKFSLYWKLAKEVLRPIRYNHTRLEYYEWELLFGDKLKQFEDIHRGQDCFIIGSGPSLRKMDLTPLSNYFTFGLNKIFLIFEEVQFDLDYLVSVNELVIEQSKSQFEQLTETKIFLSNENSRKIEILGNHIYKLDTSAIWSFYDDLTKPIAQGYTVTFVAMQIAFYMGFSNVFLIGIDHHFQQKGKPNEKQNLVGDDVNHFHPGYFKDMDWHLADLEGNEASYALAKQRYHQSGRSIIDATVDGKLTVFPKISFEEALSKAKRKSS